MQTGRLAGQPKLSVAWHGCACWLLAGAALLQHPIPGSCPQPDTPSYATCPAQDAADRLALARRPMAARQGTREFVRGKIGSMPFTPGAAWGLQGHWDAAPVGNAGVSCPPLHMYRPTGLLPAPSAVPHLAT